MLRLLIDADFFCYRAASAGEYELEFDSDTTFIVGDFKKQKKVFEKSIADLMSRFDTDKVLLTWTDTENFRKTIDPNYKGNRTKRKPAGYKKLKEWAKDCWDSIQKPGLEADDVMGILATNGSLKNFILCSPDKDMQQIPCRIWNTKEEFEVDPKDALRKVFEQALTGDVTDGYKGCEGVGAKVAKSVLNGCETEEDYWDAVTTTFIEYGQTEEDAIRNLRLARILQASDWDGEAQQPIPYSPWK